MTNAPLLFSQKGKNAYHGAFKLALDLTSPLFSYTLRLSDGNICIKIVLMAHSVYSRTGLSQESKRLAENLQSSNKLLLEANEELKKAIRARSRFMASMSHELRSPLNVIIGFSELMLDEVLGKINEEQRQGLNDILSSGKRLLKLIDDILELFTIESGKNH